MRPFLDATALRVGLVLIVVLVLQVTLTPNMQIAGASADLMLLFALCSAIAAGPALGALCAFAFGMGFDLMLATPFGLSALVYVIAAYSLGLAVGRMAQEGWITVTFTVALATGLAVMLYAALARVFGEPWLPTGRLVRVVAVEMGFNAFLAPVALKISRWTVADAPARRR